MATYITPKTDWQATDPITPADYNRIKNNLVYINDIFNSLYGNYPFDPGADIGAQEFFKASKFNMFEECVEHLQRSGMVYTFGEKSHYEENGRMPNYNQLNRLELCIAAYANIDVDVTGVTVSPKTIGFKKFISELPASNLQQLTATITPSNAFNKNVTWSSSDESIATVDTNGKISLKAKGGEVFIAVVTEDGGFSDVATVYSIIKVNTISISGDIEISQGSTLNITPQVSYAPTQANYISISYSSSDENVFTVNSEGIITGVAQGTANLTVTITQAYPDDPNPYVTTATKAVSVIAQFVPVESITITPETLSLEKNSTATLVATITPANATQQGIIWTSDKPGVVQVIGSGTSISIKSKNTTTTAIITAMSEDGIHSATCQVTVKIKSTGTMFNGNVMTFAVVQKTSSAMAIMPYYFIPVNLDDYTQKISYGNGGIYGAHNGSFPSNLHQSCKSFIDNVLSDAFKSKLGTFSNKYFLTEKTSSSRTFTGSSTSYIVPNLTELGLSLPKYDKNESYDIGYKGIPACGFYYLNGRNPITNEETTDLTVMTRSSILSKVYAVRYENYQSSNNVETIEYTPSQQVIQFFKPLIYVNYNIKVFPDILYNDVDYIIDFNNSPDSVYLKDIVDEYGTITTCFICDPPDEIRQQLGVM